MLTRNGQFWAMSAAQVRSQTAYWKYWSLARFGEQQAHPGLVCWSPVAASIANITHCARKHPGSPKHT